MENRFGLKDLILMVLLVAAIVVVLLGMKQYDRQWETLRTIQEQQKQQTTQLQDLTRALSRAVVSTSNSATASAASSPAFARIEAARKMPNYAQGDTFIIGTTKIEKITPFTAKDAYGIGIVGRVLESLLTRDPITLAWQPLLAKSLPTISADGLTFTFDLREDVTFSDGQPMTADDVVFSYNFLMTPLMDDPGLKAVYGKIKNVAKIDDHQVVFTFSEPYFKSEDLAGGMWILPKHFYENFSVDQYNKAPGLLMGSGAYKLENPKTWAPGQQLQLVRNNAYWGPPAPFDKIVYKMFGEDVTKLTDFRNGDLDFPDNLFPEQYRELLKDPALVARTHHYEYDTPTAGYRYIGWNQRRDGKPTRFADKRVRMAMTLLTDRQRMCDQLNDKLASVISGPFFGGNPQADPTIHPWPYDPDRAKALLKEAGYSDRDGTGVLRNAAGEPFRFQLTYPSGNPAYERMALFLKDGYTQAGILTDLAPLEWPVFSTKLKNRDFDAITLGWNTSLESDLYPIFSTDQIKDGGYNNVSYSDPQLDQLIAKARRTMDSAQRMKLWRACHRLLHEDQPYTFLLTRKELVFVDGRFKNLQLLPLGLNSDLEWFVPTAEQKYP